MGSSRRGNKRIWTYLNGRNLTKMGGPTLSVLLLSYFAYFLSVQVNGGLLKNLSQDDPEKANLTCQDYIPEQCYWEQIDHRGDLRPYKYRPVSQNLSEEEAIQFCQI